MYVDSFIMSVIGVNYKPTDVNIYEDLVQKFQRAVNVRERGWKGGKPRSRDINICKG